MSYEDALRDLQERVPTRMVPDVDRITALAELLGDPQATYPSIHITGTNGKTSTARMVTALLGALGIQAGTYTSPHLQTIRERIRVGGQPISKDDFAHVHHAIAPLVELVDARETGRVTYFELLTAMAYWWFADHPVDVGVFEVGMGGSWDATNLIRGDVAVITPIDHDHPILGQTLPEIAQEKAGIIKSGATVVVGEQDPAVFDVIRRAAEQHDARLLLAGTDVAVDDRRRAVGGQSLDLRTPSRRYADVMLPLHGAHQADNAALALGAVHALLGDLEAVGDDVVREALTAVEVPGRLEIVHRQPTVLLDGAHNPAGAARAAEAVVEAFAFRDVILVVGCLSDKDAHGILRPFRGLASHVVVTPPPSDRATPMADLVAAAEAVWADTSVAVETGGTLVRALEKATGVAGPDDAVLVTGSLYLVGAARDVYVPADAD
ncbi:MAG: bifunctional folylpolyglutamate synthase/dihydrofolate synthase [Actinomycetota bacterium]|nr:bifunctional folylpolyglutamate synthase/dihydrofolate synthase [Actinomycetota bacterium]